MKKEKKTVSKRTYAKISDSQKKFDSDKEQNEESSISYPDDFDGPVQRRSVTDPLFSLLLVLTWSATGMIGYWAFINGEPATLLHPFDYKGRFCGIDMDQNGSLLPPFYHPVDALGNGICVEECPKENLLNPFNRSQMYCKEDDDLLQMIGCHHDGQITENLNLLIICGGCMFQLNSIKAMDFCVPGKALEVLQRIDNAANITGFDPIQQFYIPSLVPYLESFVHDIWVSRNIVIGFGLGVSLTLGFCFLILLRIQGLASIFIWGAAMLTPVTFLLGGIYCHKYAFMHKQNPSGFQDNKNYIKFILYSSYALYIAAGIILSVLVFLRKRISLAISLAKVAAKSVIAFPFTVIYPIIQLIGFLMLFIPWCIVIIFLAGTGTPVQKTKEIFSYEINYTSYEYTKDVQFGFGFLVFTLFWSSEFILAMGQITLAMCYSKWYFTTNKKRKIASSVLGCMCLSFSYHMGTAAFGSIILAIVRFIRAILLWVQRKIKNSGLKNKSADIIFCCCRCCLQCLEKCLKYVSKSAYIQTAIFSYSFCKASRQSFLLIFRNAARMFTVGIVSELSMICCKLFIVSGASILSYFFMTEYHDAEVYSALSIVCVVALLSWFVANLFLAVLGIAINTMLHCFLADEEMNPEGSCYVPKDLEDFIQRVESEGTHE